MRKRRHHETGMSRAIGRLVMTAFGVMVLVYFGWHAFASERGIFALFNLNREIDGAQSDLAQLQEERQTLEKRVELLNAKSVDLDMLDEQSRKVLGLSGKNEMVIFRHQ